MTQPAPGPHPPPHPPVPPQPNPPPPGWAYAPPHPPGPPEPAYAGVAPKRPNVPTGPVPYQQLMRGPRRAWWRPLVSLLLVVAFMAIATMLAGLVWTLLLVATGRNPATDIDPTNLTMSWDMLLFNNLLLACGIPATILATWIAHRTKVGFIQSVSNRFRWGWYFSVFGLLFPLFAIYVGVTVWLDPPENPGQNAHAWLIVAVVLTTQMLQCAGEEYVFRAWFLQNIGAWFANKWVALVVPLVPSVALFALAHGSMHPLMLLDLGLFALAASLLAWRTGGVEASIALHSANNMAIMLITAFTGGFEDGFVDTDTTGSWDGVLTTLVVQALALGIVFWWARRRGVHSTDPAALAPFATPADDEVPAPIGPGPAYGPQAYGRDPGNAPTPRG